MLRRDALFCVTLLLLLFTLRSHPPPDPLFFSVPDPVEAAAAADSKPLLYGDRADEEEDGEPK